MSSPALSFASPRVRVVGSFHELADTRFEHGINALCWPRVLEGDFAEIVSALPPGAGIVGLEAEELQALPLSAAGRQAVKLMLADRARLEALGLQPELNAVFGHLREPCPGLINTEVYSFHADSATVPADTWLCTYHGAASEGLNNEDAERKVDHPATRAALLAECGGADDEAFREWLNDHCYDLHYAPLPGARPFVFGVGHLWKIATEHAGCVVPPCVHRAPETLPGDATRLLLIA
ncbi:MAG: hypothetical protein K1X78_10430 [Verrucomicrobiaceae bacterium]|nr:hypothetical protein [Verrucomicrobiaceae bacterium]